MSDNYRFYVMKMAERRLRLAESAGLRQQLFELFEAVARYEAIWALEIRIEKSR